MTQVVTYPNRCGAHMMATDSSGHCGYCGRPAGDPMGKPWTPPEPEFQVPWAGILYRVLTDLSLDRLAFVQRGLESSITGVGDGVGDTEVVVQEKQLIIDRCKSLLDRRTGGQGWPPAGESA